MTRLAFAEQLEKAAETIIDTPVAELQILLRRAALRVRNVEQIPMEPAWEDGLKTVADELGLERSAMIRAIVRDWLTANSYVPVHLVDEESEVDGNA